MVALALIGCDAPPAAKEPPPVSAPPPPPPSSAPPAAREPPPVVSSAPPAPPPPRFGQVELATTQGDLVPLLRDEGQRAKQKGLTPIVYFYADWCAPCRAFQQQMQAPEIQEALEGAYLVKLNMDDWHDKLRNTGFAPKKIPSFYTITDAGRPTGKMFDGDKWGKAPTAERIGKAIKAFREASSPPSP